VGVPVELVETDDSLRDRVTPATLEYWRAAGGGSTCRTIRGRV